MLGNARTAMKFFVYGLVLGLVFAALVRRDHT